MVTPLTARAAQIFGRALQTRSAGQPSVGWASPTDVKRTTHARGKVAVLSHRTPLAARVRFRVMVTRTMHGTAVAVKLRSPRAEKLLVPCLAPLTNSTWPGSIWPEAYPPRRASTAPSGGRCISSGPRVAACGTSTAASTSTCVPATEPRCWGTAIRQCSRPCRRLSSRGAACSYENELHALLARELCEAIPCCDRVRFTGSGSEATMHCLRLARAFTGRTKLLKFEGNFHGYHDQVMFALSAPASGPGPETHPAVEPASSGMVRHAGRSARCRAV